MGRASRTKGTRGEQEVVLIFNAHGFQTWRTPNSGSFTHSPGDVRGVPGVHVEVKRRERLQMDEWTRQCETDAQTGDIPAVVYRRSAEPWRVVIPLEDFIDLLLLREL